jgi:hypothetical protein
MEGLNRFLLGKPTNAVLALGEIYFRIKIHSAAKYPPPGIDSKF